MEMQKIKRCWIFLVFISTNIFFLEKTSLESSLSCFQKALKIYNGWLYREINIQICNVFYMESVCFFLALTTTSKRFEVLKESLRIRQLYFAIDDDADDGAVETQFHLAAAYISEKDEEADLFCYNEVIQIQLTNIISWRIADYLHQYRDLEKFC